MPTESNKHPNIRQKAFVGSNDASTVVVDGKTKGLSTEPDTAISESHVACQREAVGRMPEHDQNESVHTPTREPAVLNQKQDETWVPHKNDVLHGTCPNHYGNRYFVFLIERNLEAYTNAHAQHDDDDKKSMSDSIISHVNDLGGKFLLARADEFRKPDTMPVSHQRKKVHGYMMRRIKKRPSAVLQAANATKAESIATSNSLESQPEGPFKKRRIISIKLHDSPKIATKTTHSKNGSIADPSLRIEPGKKNDLSFSSMDNEGKSTSAEDSSEDGLGDGMLEEKLFVLKTPTDVSDTSILSSLSSVPSIRSDSNGSGRVVGRMFCSPPPVPSKRLMTKTSNSRTSPLNFNAAKALSLGMPDDELLSPTSTSFDCAKLLSPRLSTGCQGIHEAIARSPGFIESPIGWPSFADASYDDDSCSVTCCSLLQGLMIDSPGLGPFPSPLSNVRRISTTWSSPNCSSRKKKIKAKNSTSTSLYTMGQSRSFSFLSRKTPTKTDLQSLRVNLTPLYSNELGEGVSYQENWLTSPATRSMFDVIGAIDSSSFGTASLFNGLAPIDAAEDGQNNTQSKTPAR